MKIRKYSINFPSDFGSAAIYKKRILIYHIKEPSGKKYTERMIIMKTTIRRMLMNTVIAMAFLAVMGVAAFAYEAENVDYVKTSTARGVKLSGPSTLRQGSSWSLTGSVYSDAIHSEITVSVTDSSGNVVLQGTEAFNHVYTLQGSSIDLRNMIFGNLTAGTYTYSITIRELLDNGANACTEVTNTLYSRPFTVS